MSFSIPMEFPVGFRSLIGQLGTLFHPDVFHCIDFIQFLVLVDGVYPSILFTLLSASRNWEPSQRRSADSNEIRLPIPHFSTVFFIRGSLCRMNWCWKDKCLFWAVHNAWLSSRLCLSVWLGTPLSFSVVSTQLIRHRSSFLLTCVHIEHGLEYCSHIYFLFSAKLNYESRMAVTEFCTKH